MLVPGIVSCEIRKGIKKSFYSTTNVRNFLQQREIDLVWSLKVKNIERSIVNEGEPVLYHLKDAPRRGFVRKEPQIVPPGTELPPERKKNTLKNGFLNRPKQSR